MKQFLILWLKQTARLYLPGRLDTSGFPANRSFALMVLAVAIVLFFFSAAQSGLSLVGNLLLTGILGWIAWAAIKAQPDARASSAFASVLLLNFLLETVMHGINVPAILINLFSFWGIFTSIRVAFTVPVPK